MYSRLAAYLSFAAYGLFWGTWGAALPALRSAADVTDAQLGTALLFVGLGGLPAMPVTGRAVDRFGARITGGLLVSLALAGLVIAVVGHGFATLALGMLLVGAASGAADVAQNALAGLAEQRTGRRVITISHAIFSSFVVAGSLGTGLLGAVGVSVTPIFAGAGALMLAAGVAVHLLGDGPPPGPRTFRADSRRTGFRFILPFLGVGLVGALSYATENAHQSWSAIFLADELGASAGLMAAAPATFATFAALARFAAGIFTRIPPRVLLVGGGLVALAGTLVVSVSGTAAVALAGLALAAVGTSVLFPTLLSTATRDVPPDHRGRVTSAVTAMAYLGFVLGPVYVGLLAHAVSLRGAMVGVAALMAAFVLLSPVVTRRSRTTQPTRVVSRV